MRAACIRCVKHEGVTRFHESGSLVKNHPNAFAHRAEMHRHVRRVGHQIAFRIKDRAGEIEALFNVDRVAGVGQCDTHLLGNRHEQIVENFEQHWVSCGADGVGALSLFGAFKH